MRIFLSLTALITTLACSSETLNWNESEQTTGDAIVSNNLESVPTPPLPPPPAIAPKSPPTNTAKTNSCACPAIYKDQANNKWVYDLNDDGCIQENEHYNHVKSYCDTNETLHALRKSDPQSNFHAALTCVRNKNGQQSATTVRCDPNVETGECDCQTTP